LTTLAFAKPTVTKQSVINNATLHNDGFFILKSSGQATRL
jgi:hypothetical protein